MSASTSTTQTQGSLTTLSSHATVLHISAPPPPPPPTDINHNEASSSEDSKPEVTSKRKAKLCKKVITVAILITRVLAQVLHLVVLILGSITTNSSVGITRHREAQKVCPAQDSRLKVFGGTPKWMDFYSFFFVLTLLGLFSAVTGFLSYVTHFWLKRFNPVLWIADLLNLIAATALLSSAGALLILGTQHVDRGGPAGITFRCYDPEPLPPSARAAAPEQTELSPPVSAKDFKDAIKYEELIAIGGLAIGVAALNFLIFVVVSIFPPRKERRAKGREGPVRRLEIYGNPVYEASSSGIFNRRPQTESSREFVTPRQTLI